MSILTWDDSTLRYIDENFNCSDQGPGVMRILTWTTGYYITINLLRTSHIVRRSDDEDTEVRRLGIIIQLTVEGYCKDKGCLSIISNGMTRQYTTMVQRGTTQHHAMIKRNDKALYNNQLDEAWDGTMGSNMPRIEDWSTCLYTTTVLLLLHPLFFVDPSLFVMSWPVQLILFMALTTLKVPTSLHRHA